VPINDVGNEQNMLIDVQKSEIAMEMTISSLNTSRSGERRPSETSASDNEGVENAVAGRKDEE
jgi:hypothetical protein